MRTMNCIQFILTKKLSDNINVGASTQFMKLDATVRKSSFDECMATLVRIGFTAWMITNQLMRHGLFSN